MNLSDFDYELPESLIAQTPAKVRDQSRLLVYNRASGVTEHRKFADILEYLRSGDVLVINSTRVNRARVFGKRGETRIEVFLLKRTTDPKNPRATDKTPHPVVYDVLLRPAKKVKIGDMVVIADGVSGTCISKDIADGTAVMEFNADPEPYGEMPLPPYIKTGGASDGERYQTVYAHDEKDGSSAAPTAGLHWTPELLERARAMGVTVCEIVLTVGLGTFRPVKTENILEHKMHSEHFVIPHATADIINRAKADGRRVICVGTTVVRALESGACDAQRVLGADKAGSFFVKAGEGDTDIFIYPPYKFRVCDALVTNFHLPKSTLLILVSAFLGREKAIEIYKDAIKNKYRFFSFGDACFFV